MQAQRKRISFIGLGDIGVADELYDYIRVHPEVCVVPTPTNFFCDTTFFAKGLSWYENHFDHTAVGKYCGELAFDYIKSSQAASLIARSYSTARLLAVIDNPLVGVRVAYLEAIKSKKITSRVTVGKFLEDNHEILQSLRYGHNLHQYFGYYSQNDLLVLTSSDITNDPLKIVAKVYEHLGLNSKYVPPRLIPLVPIDDDSNAKKKGKIKRLFKYIKKLFVGTYVYFIKKWHNRKKIEKTRLEQAKEIILNPELEQALIRYFKADVALLDNLLHRNLSIEWGFNQE